jgi:hypothetical protein
MKKSKAKTGTHEGRQDKESQENSDAIDELSSVRAAINRDREWLRKIESAIMKSKQGKDLVARKIGSHLRRIRRILRANLKTWEELQARLDRNFPAEK